MLVPILSDQITELSALEQRASRYPWSESDLHDSLQQGHHCFSCVHNEEIIGYCVLRELPEVLEILNLVVFTPFQGRGLGGKLLAEVIGFAIDTAAHEIWLEVRASNQIAKQLYMGNGFVVDAERLGYYPVNDMQNSREDLLTEKCETRGTQVSHQFESAILMRKQLKSS